MEKIFQFQQLAHESKKAQNVSDAAVQLKKGHLWLSAQVVADTIGDDYQVYLVYYPQRGSLLLAPMSDDIFKQMHKCSLVMLKVRNMQGDKSISLQEIIIDNDLEKTDRPLEYKAAPGMPLLQIQLAAASTEG